MQKPVLKFREGVSRILRMLTRGGGKKLPKFSLRNMWTVPYKMNIIQQFWNLPGAMAMLCTLTPPWTSSWSSGLGRRAKDGPTVEHNNYQMNEWKKHWDSTAIDRHSRCERHAQGNEQPQSSENQRTTQDGGHLNRSFLQQWHWLRWTPLPMIVTQFNTPMTVPIKYPPLGENIWSTETLFAIAMWRISLAVPCNGGHGYFAIRLLFFTTHFYEKVSIHV